MVSGSRCGICIVQLLLSTLSDSFFLVLLSFNFPATFQYAQHLHCFLHLAFAITAARIHTVNMQTLSKLATTSQQSDRPSFESILLKHL